MYLLVVIPCLNEAATLGEIIDNIPLHIPGVTQTEILVVDDGSTDESTNIAQSKGVSVISHPFSMGVGTAFNTGLNQAIQVGADLLVNIDGDGQFDPRDIPELVQPVSEGKADFVTASRFKDKSLIPSMPGLKKWGNRRVANLISILTGQKFYDVSCGFRAYSREAMLNLNLIGKFTYTQETFLDLVFKNLKIMEVPLQIKGEREFGKSRVASNLWNYGINTSKIIFRTFRDYKPLRFFGAISAVLFVASFLLGSFFSTTISKPALLVDISGQVSVPGFCSCSVYCFL